MFDSVVRPCAEARQLIREGSAFAVELAMHLGDEAVASGGRLGHAIYTCRTINGAEIHVNTVGSAEACTLVAVKTGVPVTHCWVRVGQRRQLCFRLPNMRERAKAWKAAQHDS